jgi:CBS-domain-containing membrane protein
MSVQKLSVADVMTIDPIVVHVDASIEDADLLLRSTYIKGIPVVDGDGVLVGVVDHAHLVAYRFAHRAAPSSETSSEGASTRGLAAPRVTFCVTGASGEAAPIP